MARLLGRSGPGKDRERRTGFPVVRASIPTMPSVDPHPDTDAIVGRPGVRVPRITTRETVDDRAIWVWGDLDDLAQKAHVPVEVARVDAGERHTPVAFEPAKARPYDVHVHHNPTIGFEVVPNRDCVGISGRTQGREHRRIRVGEEIKNFGGNGRGWQRWTSVGVPGRLEDLRTDRA